MKWLLLFFLMSLAACNSGDNGSSKPKVSSGDMASTQAANAYIQESKNQIPPSLQVKNDDLEALKAEGLVTQEEAPELAQIIK